MNAVCAPTAFAGSGRKFPGGDASFPMIPEQQVPIKTCEPALCNTTSGYRKFREILGLRADQQGKTACAAHDICPLRATGIAGSISKLRQDSYLCRRREISL